MSKKLTKVFEYLIAGKKDEAEALLKDHIIETSAKIQRDLSNKEEMIEDYDRDPGLDLTKEISDHKNEIENEEMYGENDAATDQAAADVAADLAADVELTDVDLELGDEDVIDLESDDIEVDSLEDAEEVINNINDKVEEIADEFEELKAQFDALQSVEEIEHGEDMNHDGVIGGEEGTMSMDVVVDNKVDESVELTDVKVDMKDETGSHKSPVAQEKKLELGGKAVKVHGKGHTGFDRETVKVDAVTKHDNTAKSGSDALKKITENSKKLNKK